MRLSIPANEKHAAEPRPGDYWHEMFCPACVVVGAIPGHVVICKTTKAAGKNRWTWDLTKLDMLSKSAFKNSLKSPCDKYWWADVAPECHMFVASVLEEQATASGDRTALPPDQRELKPNRGQE